MDQKYSRLISFLQSLGKITVAFSGGVDSTFLLAAAKEAVDDGVLALTATTPYVPAWELDEARTLTDNLGIRHEIIELSIIPEIRENPSDRCYHCKKAIFGNLKSRAEELGFPVLTDGSNTDDLGDYRPGLRALRELGIVSPMLECGLSKDDIRKFSRDLGLPTWNKPAYACLLTRLPVNHTIDVDELQRIERSEGYLRSLGFAGVRVRLHGDIARIEVFPQDRTKLFDTDLLDRISDRLRNFGFRYVALELSGYRMGSMNPRL